MIINKIILDNYGVFYGRHEFLLQPKQSGDKYKPIILFGGMNGSGKTTLFDSIKLCFYGQNGFAQLNNGKYTEYLNNRIHHSKDLVIQPNHAAIEIEFQHSKFGEVSTYCIIRHWENTGSKTIENLIIKKIK